MGREGLIYITYKCEIDMMHGYVSIELRFLLEFLESAPKETPLELRRNSFFSLFPDLPHAPFALTPSSSLLKTISFGGESVFHGF